MTERQLMRILLEEKRIGPDILLPHGRLMAVRLDSGDAEIFLESNTANNRHPRKPTIALYSKDMATDSFYPSAPIVVSSTWEILDGQHRLAAQRDAGATVTWPIFHVAEGFDDKIMARIDIGVRRNVSDLVSMLHNARVGPTVTSAISLDRSNGNSERELSMPERAELCMSEPLINLLTELAQIRTTGEGRRRLVNGASLAGALRCIRKVPEAKAFFAQVFAGSLKTDGVPASTPAVALMQHLSDSGKTGQRSARATMVKSIVSWNAHAQGRDVSKLAYRDGQKIPDVALLEHRAEALQ